MRKSIVKSILAIGIVIEMILGSAPTVYARSLEETSEEVTVVAESMFDAYEESVISRMAGRAGASTVTGAKGIAFEIIYADAQNLKNALFLFKPFERIKLSPSSTDQVADLVVTDIKGNVKGLIQCKNCTSISGIRQVLEQVASGQYDGAQLVGTKECAKAFNEAAVKAGIKDRMLDSNISSKFTESVARKYFGTNINDFMTCALKNSATVAAISSSASLIDSKIEGCSDAETLSNIAVDTTSSLASYGGANAAKYIVTAGLAYVGASGAVTVVGAFAAEIVTGIVIIMGIDKLDEKYGIKKELAKIYDDSMTTTARFIVDSQDKIEETIDDIVNESKVVSAKMDVESQKALDKIRDVYISGKQVVDTGADDTVAFWAETGSSCINYISK